MTNCVRQDQVHNIGGFDETYVRFINIGDTAISNIRGSLYDTSGNVVGATTPVLIDELAAKAHVWRNRNQLSDIIGDTWNGTASLKINNADSNLRLLNLNFINSEPFFNFSCYEPGQWKEVFLRIYSKAPRAFQIVDLPDSDQAPLPNDFRPYQEQNQQLHFWFPGSCEGMASYS